MRFFLLFVTIFFITPAFSATDDWTAYGKGSGGGHFSALIISWSDLVDELSIPPKSSIYFESV